MSGRHHRTCQWAASIISGKPMSWPRSFPSASDMIAPFTATPFWGSQLCKTFLSHSAAVCPPSDSEHRSHWAFMILTVQVMAGPGVYLLGHGPDADSRHGLSHAELAKYAGHTDILSAHSRGSCSL